MKKVYISKNYSDRFTASSKAKYDCEVIVEGMGYRNIGLPRAFIKNPLIGRIWTLLSNVLAYIIMPHDAVVFLQYPVAFLDKQINRAKQKRNKVVVLIHDLNALRGGKDFEYKEELMKADALIVHSSQMKEWCEKKLPGCRCIVLGVFDYLYDNSFQPATVFESPVSVAFAGNIGKSVFLDRLDVPDLKFNLFGVGADKRHFQRNMEYKGCFPPDHLWKNLSSMFGLVWDGDSCDTCSGIVGEYLRYIAPHKLSLYISCGLPVIVWSESAMADFVRKNNIGVCVASLFELETILKDMTRKDYMRLSSNVSGIREKVMSGYFLRTAVANFESWVI